MRMLGGVIATLGIVVGCGGSPPVAATVGQVGGSLSAHAQAVPAGAEVCAMKEALAEAPKPNPEMAKTCEKAQKSDRVWRGSMTVLAAYGESLSSVASGGDEKKSGQLEAALTGIKGTGWAQTEDVKEKAARDAAAELVKQMGEEREDGSLEARVKAAAPHVTTICDGLAPYLEEQAKGFADLQTDVEAKKKTPLARRCAVTGYHLQPDGEVRQFDVFSPNNPKGKPKTIELEEAGTIEFWFEATSKHGCHEWDSDFGQNYAFEIEE